MMSQKMNKSGKIITIIGAIFISFLFISTVTAVPQVQSKGIMEKISEKESFESIMEKITKNIDGSIGESQSATSTSSINDFLANINGNDFRTTDITSFLETLLTLIIEYITQYIINGNGEIPTIEGGLLNVILTILKAVFTVPIVLFQILLNASVGLIGGIINIIKSFITIILIFVAGLQTALTLGAILMLFIGIMSKIGIKALVVMGAPIFALLAVQIAISSGTILGGIAVTIFSLISILLILALPLSIIGGLYLLLNSDGGNGGDLLDFDLNFNPPDREGLLYMLLSIIFSNLKQ